MIDGDLSSVYPNSNPSQVGLVCYRCDGWVVWPFGTAWCAVIITTPNVESGKVTFFVDVVLSGVYLVNHSGSGLYGWSHTESSHWAATSNELGTSRKRRRAGSPHARKARLFLFFFLPNANKIWD